MTVLKVIEKLKSKSNVNLNLALLGKRQPYLWYRFRYFILNNILLTFLHLFEFYLLTLFFHGSQFYYLVLLRAATFIIKDGWWGVLEGLREGVRTCQLKNDYQQITKQVSLWFWMSIFLSILVCLIGITAIFLSQSTQQGINIYFTVYGSVIVLQLAADIILRVFHSGMYALTRIFRPWWTIFLAELIAFVIIITMWSSQKMWALPAAYIFSSIIALMITAYYTLESYKAQGLSPLIAISFCEFYDWLKTLTWLPIILACIASVVIGLEGIILWLFQPALRADPIIFKLIYLLSPQIAGGFNWSRITYFDFKKLSSPAKKFFLPYFYRGLMQFSVLVGVFFWLLSVITTRFLLPEISWTILFDLLPLFIIRALLALRQMYFFSNSYYFDVLLSALFIIIAAILGIFLKTPEDFFCLFFLMICFSFLITVKKWFPSTPIFKRVNLSSLYQLLVKIKKIKGPIYICCFSFVKQLEFTERYRFFQKLEILLHRKGMLVRCSDRKIISVYWQVNNKKNWQQFLETESVGVIRTFQETAWQANGIEALKKASFLNIVDNYYLKYNINIPEQDALIHFQQDFPQNFSVPWFKLSKLGKILPNLNVMMAGALVESLSQVWQEGMCYPRCGRFVPIIYWQENKAWCLLAYVDKINVQKFKAWQVYFWRINRQSLLR